MHSISSYKAISVSATASLIVLSIGTAVANGEEFKSKVIRPSIRWEFPLASRGQLASPLLGEYRTRNDTELSQELRTAFGHDGLDRLSRFRKLRENWDHRGAFPLDEASVRACSEFFRDTNIQPEALGVFLSPHGRVAVNWEDAYGNLIELEFLTDRVKFFFERSGEEGEVNRNDVGRTNLLQMLRESIA